MRFVLDLLYLLGLVLASPWLIYRSIKTHGWRDLPEKLGLVDLPQGVIWLHGSSVGEVSLIEPLIRLLERTSVPLAISSDTATGMRLAKRAYPAHRVFRFPLDFSFVQRRVMARLQPRLVIIVESDLWPNHLLAAERYGVNVAVINAKLSERSVRLHRMSRIVPRAMRKIQLVAAQTDTHAERFRSLGVAAEKISVTGNMKYDLTRDMIDESLGAELRQKLGFADGASVIIGGSLHPREDEDLIAAFVESKKRDHSIRLIIVPRYPDQAPAVMQKLADSGLAAVLKSQLDQRPDQRLADESVLVVDTLGELRRLYSAADIAFVGGSLYFRGSNKGGHNLMEPAIIGLPVVFGPHNFSFRETVADLLAADAGVMVQSRDELTAVLVDLVGSKAKRTAIGERAKRVVLDGQGASKRNFELVLPILERTIELQPKSPASTMPPPVSNPSSQ